MGKIDQVKPQNGHTQPGGSHEELITSHHDLQTPRDTRAAFPAGPEIEEQKKTVRATRAGAESHEKRGALHNSRRSAVVKSRKRRSMGARPFRKE